jgi:hypothetical protein
MKIRIAYKIAQNPNRYSHCNHLRQKAGARLLKNADKKRKRIHRDYTP